MVSFLFSMHLISSRPIAQTSLNKIRNIYECTFLSLSRKYTGGKFHLFFIILRSTFKVLIYMSNSRIISSFLFFILPPSSIHFKSFSSFFRVSQGDILVSNSKVTKTLFSQLSYKSIYIRFRAVCLSVFGPLHLQRNHSILWCMRAFFFFFCSEKKHLAKGIQLLFFREEIARFLLKLLSCFVRELDSKPPIHEWYQRVLSEHSAIHHVWEKKLWKKLSRRLRCPAGNIAGPPFLTHSLFLSLSRT